AGHYNDDDFGTANTETTIDVEKNMAESSKSSPTVSHPGMLNPELDESRQSSPPASHHRQATRSLSDDFETLEIGNPFSFQMTTQDSLQLLVENHHDHAVEEDCVTAANVALPESITASSPGRDSPVAQESSSQPWQVDYSKEIQRLRRHIPNLQKVQMPARVHDQAEIDCLDYSSGNLVSMRTYELNSGLLEAKQKFASEITDNIPSHIHFRLLIVHDISPKLIRILGSCLSISPECFEEHLSNSGWHDNHYSDTGLEPWNATTVLIKKHTSIKWYRPVRDRLLRPYKEQESSDLLDPSKTPDSWEENPSPGKRILHSTEPLVNLIRLPWDVTLDSGGFSAWEERATPRRSRRESTPSTNESHCSRDPEEAGSSRSRMQKSTISIVMAKFANLLKISASDRTGEQTAPGSEPQTDIRSHGSTSSSVQEDVQRTERHAECCMFRDAGNCLPQIDYSDFLIRKNERQLRPRLIFQDPDAESTREALKKLLQSPYETRGAARGTQSGPLETLLMIIIRDTQRVLQSIDRALTKMDRDMLDDGLVQLHIDDWRRVLHSFEIKTRSIEISVPNFADYILPSKGGGPSRRTSKGIRVCRELLSQLKKEIASARHRTESSHRSLMTTISLVESKRGISEAESVTKLTELAFFFIPLTFAASLFSMQVQELDANTTSVGLFLVVALAITICSYALRVVIRSSTFLSFWRRWKDQIRDDRGIRPSTPIATFAVLSWSWQHVHTHVWPLYVMIPTTALLTGLWTRPLQGDIKIGLTTACAILSFGVILVALLMRYDMSYDWAQKKPTKVWHHVIVPGNGRQRFSVRIGSLASGLY
ncbi:MAG: hypothetical protein Q9166_008175, partial [cf. Caloplaca sp. 2 TL-2023]